MTKRPPIPTASPDGAVLANVGRYARGQVMLAYQMIGGVERLAEWADENPGEFFTKLFGKTVTRETEVHASEGVENLLERLSEAENAGVIDAEFELLEESDVSDP